MDHDLALADHQPDLAGPVVVRRTPRPTPARSTRNAAPRPPGRGPWSGRPCPRPRPPPLRPGASFCWCRSSEPSLLGAPRCEARHSGFGASGRWMGACRFHRLRGATGVVGSGPTSPRRGAARAAPRRPWPRIRSPRSVEERVADGDHAPEQYGGDRRRQRAASYGGGGDEHQRRPRRSRTWRTGRPRAARARRPRRERPRRPAGPAGSAASRRRTPRARRGRGPASRGDRQASATPAPRTAEPGRTGSRRSCQDLGLGLLAHLVEGDVGRQLDQPQTLGQ